MFALADLTGILLQLAGVLAILAGVVLSFTVAPNLHYALYIAWLDSNPLNYMRTGEFPGPWIV